MAKRSLKYNAAVLSVTGFVVKVIGFFYRIFIANSIGSEGLGLYQLVTPIYSLLILVLSAGVQIAVSRFVAEETSHKTDYKGMKIANLSAGIVLAAGIIVSTILLININTLVFSFTGDERTRRSLIYILLLVPPIAAASAYKGYFYGREEMLPNAIAQILEQASKLVFVILLYGTFKGKGVESMCLLAVLALLFGEVVNVLTVFIVFITRKTVKKNNQYSRKKRSWKAIKKICKVAVPISVNRLILSVIGTAESLVIPRRLMLYGYNVQESLKTFGRLSGMAAPLVFFPSMLPGALATALVPAIASAFASKRYYVANRQISQSIKLTLTMGLIFTSFFACCSHEIAELIYPGQEVGKILYILSFTGVFLYLQQTMLGILNGLSREKTILVNTLIGSVIRLISVWFLMPLYGIEAYVFSVIAGSIIVVILNFKEIIKITGISIDLGEWFLKPVATALTGSFVAILLKNMPKYLPIPLKVKLILAAGLSFAAIVLFFFLAGVIKRDDIIRWSGNRIGGEKQRKN
ncbi:MAG: polysaccharide biosynthesis protein [Clostridiaceae bacterium]|nr:polysaccharide biosynthesis protein [Clostridiaceae bacterium]